MRCYEADDIIAERKRGEKLADLAYKRGFYEGYRKAKVEFLGEEEVARQELEYDKWRNEAFQEMIAYIQEHTDNTEITDE